MTDLLALLANLPELKVVQHCFAGGDKPVDTVKIEPLQQRALGSMERKHGEAIVAAVNFCRTELPALIAERDALREVLQPFAKAAEFHRTRNTIHPRQHVRFADFEAVRAIIEQESRGE